MVNYQDEITKNLITDIGLEKYKYKVDNQNIHVYLPNKNIVSMNYKISGDSVRFKGELQVANTMPNRPGVYTYTKTNKVIEEKDGFIVDTNEKSYIVKEAARQLLLNNKYHWFLMATKMYLVQVGVIV